MLRGVLVPEAAALEIVDINHASSFFLYPPSKSTPSFFHQFSSIIQGSPWKFSQGLQYHAHIPTLIAISLKWNYPYAQ